MVSRTQAIVAFLAANTHADLAALYSPDMECQVNVSQDGGERIDGDFKGRKWHGWSDGLTTWKSFRIPYNAMANPTYDDPAMSFDLALHAEGIGLTGWDWRAKRSRWVAFDFDSIIGHSVAHKATLTNSQLERLSDLLSEIPWVTIRRSTGGNGLHIYVMLELDASITVDNHTEHAAVARAILGQMSAIIGEELAAKVDTCGGNMWIWHRKMIGTQGLEIIKTGEPLTEIPANWREHLKVISGSRRRRIPGKIEEAGRVEDFEELAGQHPRVALDDGHKTLLRFLQGDSHSWEWDSDNHMLITHTLALQAAHKELGLRGYYESASRGSSDINCFAFPLRRGAWVVRRYTPGVAEHASWEQDGSGWTRCFFNKDPDLATICRAFGAMENEKGGFVFREAEVASQAALYLGVSLAIAPALFGRQVIFKQHKDGRLIIKIERKPEDRGEHAEGFLPDKGEWVRITPMRSHDGFEPDGSIYDDIVRHLVGGNNEDAGWVINSDSTWHDEPLTHIRAALTATGMNVKEIAATVGGSVFKPWRLVNKPFQPEYPGDREWNRGAAQLRYAPSGGDELIYPTWTKVLSHCGAGLDATVKLHPWCKANGILTGGDYLKCWVASVIQQPEQPLPYLFFYNEEQNTGKSIFHEAISLLMTRGVVKAGSALTNPSGFNGELRGAVICTVEEIELSDSKVAYNRMKDWVTGREIMIHPKNETPYSVVNTTHWVQCANPIKACPIFPGDTRVTVIFVPALDPMEMIPKKKLIPMLESEAEDFLGELLRLELPESDDRLNLPPIDTDDKAVAEQLNMSMIDIFIQEHCRSVPGAVIKFADFYERFLSVAFLGNEKNQWSKIKTGRAIPRQYPKGRLSKDPNWYIGNLAWLNDDVEPGKALILEGETLKEVRS